MHKRDGYLKLHTDFTHQPNTGKDRCINMLLFLNKGWKEEWGGYLELWDKDLTSCIKVPPTWNMTVIFSTSLESLHGHPDPIKCPDDERRKSLAWYYYTGNGEPGNLHPSQTITRWRRRHPGDF